MIWADIASSALGFVGATLVYFFSFKSDPGVSYLVDDEINPRKSARSKGLANIGFALIAVSFLIVLLKSLYLLSGAAP